MGNSDIKNSQNLEEKVAELQKEIARLKQSSLQSKEITANITDSESFFYSVFEEAGVGIAIIDKGAKIIKFNKTFSNLFGYSQDELFEKTYLDMIPDEKKVRAKEFIHAMFSSKINKYQSEQVYLKKDQSNIWLKLTATTISDNNGNPQYILGMGEDITELKRQQKIRDVVYQISNAVNYADDLYDLINTIKENLKSVIDAKHFFIALYNKKTNDFSIPYIVNNKKSFDNFPAKDTLVGYVQRNRKAVLLNSKELLKLQEAKEIFIAGRLSKLWLGVPLISDEKVIGVIGVHSYEDENAFNNNDLTLLEILSNQISATIEKKRSESALQVEKAYFKELFDNSPEAIAIVDNSSKILNVNKEFTQLFGYSKKESVNKSIEELISTPELKSEALHLTNRITEGKTVKIETKRRKKDGAIVDVSLWGTPIILDAGQLAVYAIFRDISERVEAEKKLEEAKEKAEESDRLKTSFLTNMSHEIRTPMNAIIGFSELIADPVTDSETRKEFAKQIYSSSNVLLKLIDDIIDISQLDSGNLKLNLKEINISDFLISLHESFLKEINNEEEKKNIELLLHNPFGDLVAFIETDDFRFKQIFNNLLNNALKYTHDGFIEFGFDIDQHDEPIFYVRDTGIGIPEDKTDTIFNHFTKIEDRTKLYRGTGIGLSITKKLVNLLGGKIWVESNLGIGSIFYFTLPIKVKFLEFIGKRNNQVLNYNWKGKKVLVAEDEDTNFEVIKASLARTNAKIKRVFNGEAAVKNAISDDYDIILMDIKMPIIDGIEATKRIKTLKPNLPIIAQTAFIHENERNTCIAAGCNEYMPKPIKSHVLLDIMNQLFNEK